MCQKFSDKEKQQFYIAVIGGGTAPPPILALAQAVGAAIAQRGGILICGGLGGVMEAAAQGASEAGGVAIGILPGPDRQAANPFLTYSLVTNLGHARNIIIAHTASGLIAVDGSYGTISEAAIALKLGKPVVGLQVGWHLPGIIAATTPQEAVTRLWQALGDG